MPKPSSDIIDPLPDTLPAPRAERIVVRRFDPAFDGYAPLTDMLHRAFARLGAMGLNCTCVDQAEDVTRRRAEAGECFVAVSGGRVIGTMTLHASDPASACSLYRHDGVATVRQVAVDPAWQGRGVGATLLSFAGQWAAARGFALLALDTPRPAAHLLAFYRAQGFDVVDVVRFAGKRYDSAILCKRPVAVRARRLSPASWAAARVAAVWRIGRATPSRIAAAARAGMRIRRVAPSVARCGRMRVRQAERQHPNMVAHTTKSACVI
ncbi:GNAT family N-acetyltransferase [Burkholderia stagnalis]|uniref:GNAT family N-acetyltransferase n=1 Tax=Burkholderia stagnalis TaxID=1503054 RepID=UPI002AB464A6|nr:GNAT family N-acetyltransferase [Burkholderia stagnalis]MDY7806558.1 GNAT family N-acetyltransferase [Burkholderia stagnalis]